MVFDDSFYGLDAVCVRINVALRLCQGIVLRQLSYRTETSRPPPARCTDTTKRNLQKQYSGPGAIVFRISCDHNDAVVGL